MSSLKRARTADAGMGSPTTAAAAAIRAAAVTRKVLHTAVRKRVLLGCDSAPVRSRSARRSQTQDMAGPRAWQPLPGSPLADHALVDGSGAGIPPAPSCYAASCGGNVPPLAAGKGTPYEAPGPGLAHHWRRIRNRAGGRGALRTRREPGRRGRPPRGCGERGGRDHRACRGRGAGAHGGRQPERGQRVDRGRDARPVGTTGRLLRQRRAFPRPRPRSRTSTRRLSIASWRSTSGACSWAPSMRPR